MGQVIGQVSAVLNCRPDYIMNGTDLRGFLNGQGAGFTVQIPGMAVGPAAFEDLVGQDLLALV